MAAKDRIFFEETQKFGSPALYISMGSIYLAVMTLFVFGMYRQLVMQQPFGNHPMSDTGLIITTLLVLLILIASAWLLFGSRLEVRLSSKGIHYRFWPYFRREKMIAVDEIASFEVRQYKPLAEYGGWGMKRGSKGAGMAYNVSGNKGLQLVLKNGKRILFGTRRPEALQYAVKKMMEKAHE